MLEIMHGSAWCDYCEKNFNAVVLIVQDSGGCVVSVCSSCANDVVGKIKVIADELKERGL